MKNKVKKILSSLKIEEKITQIIIPILPTFNTEYIFSRKINFNKLIKFTEKYGLGGAFILNGKNKVIKKSIAMFQNANQKIPAVIAADLEHGAGSRFNGFTNFPQMLAIGAANDEELAYQVGKASAQEGRSLGINWTFSPVIDVISNPFNPITQDRALGNDPEKIYKLANAYIKGLQENGIASCLKHFPGDGDDIYDQHITTPVNSMSKEKWKKIFGLIYQQTINSGAWSVMIGHIALPAFDNRKDENGIYQPATLSKIITTDILRKKLKFDGLIVSDAMGMGGITAKMNKKERVINAVNAGCDMLLFIDEDYQDTMDIIVEAVEKKLIKEERLNQAVSKIIEFKIKLGLFDKQKYFKSGPTNNEIKHYTKISDNISEKAIVVVKNIDDAFPVQLQKGDSVLTVTLSRGDIELNVIDQELKKRGLKVTHYSNYSNTDFDSIAKNYDKIFINFVFPANYGTGSARSIGKQNRIFMADIIKDLKGKVVYTSFASPYHLHDIPQMPNYINTHSFSINSQQAIVKAWLGELNITKNKSPVTNLTR